MDLQILHICITPLVKGKQHLRQFFFLLCRRRRKKGEGAVHQGMGTTAYDLEPSIDRRLCDPLRLELNNGSPGSRRATACLAHTRRSALQCKASIWAFEGGIDDPIDGRWGHDGHERRYHPWDREADG